MVCLFITGATNVSAIRINEVEANPSGQDKGNEWIELYSENEVNVEGYYLQADDKTFNLSGTFSGYFIIQFTGLWIDNSNETVFLKNLEGIVDDTGVFADSGNDEKTWSFCESEWILITGTKNEDNGCDDEINEEETSEEVASEEDEENESLEAEIFQNNSSSNKENILNVSNENPKNKKIILKKLQNNVDITEETTPSYKLRKSIIYGFVSLCVLLVVLMALRKL